ncbi:MAG: HDIG domain-containing protein [Acidimicrobiia bacterium]|nr:HDIG domain-containing protein [Acidimicrobiia bacterium]
MAEAFDLEGFVGADVMALVALLEDQSLSGAVLSTLERCARETDYDSLSGVPQGRDVPVRSLEAHMFEVATVALRLADVAIHTWDVEIDTDSLLASALLHDVDKMLILDGPIGCHPPRFRKGYGPADHGPVGADVCRQSNVPYHICEIVRHHSPFVGGLPDSLEAALMLQADLTADYVAALSVGLEPFYRRVKTVPASGGGEQT